MQQQLGILFYLSCAAVVLGGILFVSGSKKRNDAGDWGAGIQWGYLLLMVGLFGVLALWLQWSMTACLLLFTVITGIVWLWHKLAVKKLPENSTEPRDKKGRALDNNHFRDYMSGFFPIIAIIFVLRTFIIEPFVIPSSSMRPGLVKGDFVLVNKFSYGLRVPVLNTVFLPIGKIERGDVVVFNYPMDTHTNYIKRIIGLPGDVIEYKDKVLSVNGQVENDVSAGNYQYADDNDASIRVDNQRFHAEFFNKKFDVLKVDEMPSLIPGVWNSYQEARQEQNYTSSGLENCEYAADGSAFKCTVPAGHYFAMGDNRDHSADSRYWGFVSDDLIVGKAMVVWMNFGELSRIGTVIK